MRREAKMKLGFIGAGGTGKTTVMNLVSKQLGLPIMKSASRQVFESRRIREDDQFTMTEAQKWNLQNRIFVLKQELDATTEHFIADRTLLDHFCYCLYRCSKSVDKRMTDNLQTRVLDNLKKYDFLFYFPTGVFDAQPDGLRADDYAYRLMIGAIMEGLLHRYEIPCYLMQESLIHERVEGIKRVYFAQRKPSRVFDLIPEVV
jgi:integrase